MFNRSEHCLNFSSFLLFREPQISFPVATPESPKRVRILEMIEEKRTSLRMVHDEIGQLNKVVNKAKKKLHRKISQSRKLLDRFGPYMKGSYLEYHTNNTANNSLENWPK